MSMAEPITIMPLGDSITAGTVGNPVYRFPLMEKLKAAGYDVSYVGTQISSQTDCALGELPCEGYGGKNVQFLAGKIGELYRKNPADIVMIHAGHNQFADRHPIPEMLSSTRKIIETIRSIKPGATILLAQVIPSGKLPKYSYIPQFNEALVPLVKELDRPGQRFILVNQAEGFDWEKDTVPDRVHPNAQGAEKMAEKWFQALRQVLPPPKK